MRFSASVIALAAVGFVSAQNLNDFLTAVDKLPASLQTLLTSDPSAFVSVISSQFATGIPDWATDIVDSTAIPTSPNTSPNTATRTGSATSAETTAETTGNTDSTGTGTTVGPSTTTHTGSLTTGTTTSKSGNETETETGTETESSTESPSTGAAAIPTGVFGAGLLGAIGVVGALAL